MKFAEKEGLDVEWVKFAEVNGPTRAIATTKWLINRAVDQDRLTAFGEEAMAQEHVMHTHDMGEGVAVGVEEEPRGRRPIALAQNHRRRVVHAVPVRRHVRIDLQRLRRRSGLGARFHLDGEMLGDGKRGRFVDEDVPRRLEPRALERGRAGPRRRGER